MAVPTRRRGAAKQGMVRQHTALEATNTVTCSNCGAEIIPHHVCPNCGFYKGKKVKDVKEKAE